MSLAAEFAKLSPLDGETLELLADRVVPAVVTPK